MRARLLKGVDASDLIIGGALLGLGVAVSAKSDMWTGLAVVCAAALVLVALAIVANR